MKKRARKARSRQRRTTKAQMQAASDKVAAYLRTAKGRKSTAELEAALARETEIIAEQKARKKMVGRWKATAGAKGSEDA